MIETPGVEKHNSVGEPCEIWFSCERRIVALDTFLGLQKLFSLIISDLISHGGEQ